MWRLLVTMFLTSGFIVGGITGQASSRHWIQYGGYRPYIDVMRDKANGGVPRDSVFYAYAKAGETILFGSSAMYIGQGGISYVAPNGVTGSCQDEEQILGKINNLIQEQDGPDTISLLGYRPCRVEVDSTTEGIWKFEFISPVPGGVDDDGFLTTSGSNPNPRPVGSSWVQGDNWGSISAWDITVAGEINPLNGTTEVPGRVFAKYLSLNTGTFDEPLNLQTYVRTREGFTYNVDLNGMRPFGFAFFANSNGYTDDTGAPLYRSLNLDGPNTNTTLPAGANLHLPSNPDTATQFTHKIFFEPPAADLPESAPSAEGVDWLNPTLPSTPTVSSFQFTGEEGTPFKAGTSPLGGTFEFITDYTGNFAVVVDLNDDGVYGNGPDKVIGGISGGGVSTAYWDGTDAFGNAVAVGSREFNAQVQVYLGEVHFPFFDVEHVPNGLAITRLSPTNPTATQRDIFWDDRLLTLNTEESCQTEDSTVPTEPVVDLVGANSENGARGYDNNYGNCKAIDTWARVEYPLEITNTLELREADLAVEYIITEPVYTPGEEVMYTVRVTNTGPSAKVNGNLSGLLPIEFTAVTSACSDCTTYTQDQNGYAAAYDLAVGESFEIDFRATVGFEVPAGTLITQNNEVSRARDYTDPVTPNNTAVLELIYQTPNVGEEGEEEVTDKSVPVLIRTGGV